MTPESSENSESTGSNKYLIRTLLIVSIGIPVLVEFLTFFNLIKFRLWDNGNSSEQEQAIVNKVQGLAPGDTLVSEQALTITLHNYRINVGPDKWRLEMEFRALGKPNYNFNFSIDSLGMDKGITIAANKKGEWKSVNEEGYRKMEGKWQIPNGEVPQNLSFTLQKNVKADSVNYLRKKIPLKKPPIRYQEE